MPLRPQLEETNATPPAARVSYSTRFTTASPAADCTTKEITKKMKNKNGSVEEFPADDSAPGSSGYRSRTQCDPVSASWRPIASRPS